MTNDAGARPGLSLEDYQKLWIESICEVLTQIAGSPFHAAAGGLEEAPGSNLSRCHAVFALGPPLAGELAIGLAERDGLRLAQLLMGEPGSERAAFDADHREAFAELFRQIAGAAALALSARLKLEVAVRLIGTEPAAWMAVCAEVVSVRLQSAATSAPLHVAFQFSPDLKIGIESADTKPEKIEPEEALMVAPHEPSLDVLRDVELAVTLRFGKRVVLLREVLELAAGAVVELEQRIEEPVELLVGDKVIARGEVVVVEGNYGLRVTEVVGSAERMNCLRQ
jgi:flagellar motor switch protein FliN